MSQTLGGLLRANLQQRRAMIVPGCANALTAIVIADLGFEAVYLSGAGLTNMFLGMPDLGFISLPEIAQNTLAIRDAVEIPIIVDADTGFGNALNVQHCVRVLERAGANAIQIEDQRMPKRCGHFEDKSVIDTEEMLGKIKAAVDARKDKDLLIIARTDARAVEGFDSAIARLAQYAEAGADVTFLEAPESVEEIRAVPKLINRPQVMNVVVGGKSPTLPHEALAEMGFGLTLYANVALQAAVSGMQAVLGELKLYGRVEASNPLVAKFSERQRLVKKSWFDQCERKYSTKK